MATRVATLTPDGTISNTSWTVTGASAHAALSDASDASYVESSTNGATLWLNLGTTTLNPGETVYAVKVRSRHSTPSGNHSVGITVATMVDTNSLGGINAFVGSMQLINGTPSLADYTSSSFPGAASPWTATDAHRGTLNQTMIDDLRLRLVLFEFAGEAGLTRVSQVYVDLYITDQKALVADGTKLRKGVGGDEVKLWGSNFRTSSLHQVTAAELIAEMTKHKNLGLNFFRLHVETTKVKTAAGINFSSGPLVILTEVLKWMAENDCYAELCVNAAYSSNATWLESLSEAARWDERRMVARQFMGMFNKHPAVAFYSLLNEPLAWTGGSPTTWWRNGDTDGTREALFVEWLVKDAAGRTAAQQWSTWLADIMSSTDGVRMVGIGPDALVTCGDPTQDARDVLTAMEANGLMDLDIVTPHIYPRREDRTYQELYARRCNKLGIPVVSDEFYFDVVTGDGWTQECDGVLINNFDWSGFAGHSSGRTSLDYKPERQRVSEWTMAPIAPAARLKLDESSGATAADSAGFLINPGTYVNTPTYSAPDVFGDNQAITLNGTDERIDWTVLTGVGAALLTSSWSAWVKTTSTTGPMTVMGTVQTGTSMIMAIYVNSQNQVSTQGCVDVQIRGANTFGILAWTGDIDINDGRWHHIMVVVLSSTTIGIYVDGTLRSITYGLQTGPTAINFDFPMMIGARNVRGTPDRFFTGSIDDVAVYASRVPADQVLNIAESGGYLGISSALHQVMDRWFEERAWQYRKGVSRIMDRRFIPRLGQQIS